jgi:hypothetical protein
LNEKISVREGDKVRLISKFEAMMRSLALKAVRGDLKAMATVIALAEENTPFGEPIAPVINISTLSLDELENNDAIEKMRAAMADVPK